MVTITTVDNTTDSEATRTSASSSPSSSSSSASPPPTTEEENEEGHGEEGGGANTVDKGKQVGRSGPQHVTSAAGASALTPQAVLGSEPGATGATPPRLDGMSASTAMNTSGDTSSPPTKAAAPRTPNPFAPRTRKSRRRVKQGTTSTPNSTSTSSSGGVTFGSFVAKASKAKSEEWSYGDRAFRLMPRRASEQLKVRARGSLEKSPSPESTSTNTGSQAGTPSSSAPVDASTQVVVKSESSGGGEPQNGRVDKDEDEWSDARDAGKHSTSSDDSETEEAYYRAGESSAGDKLDDPRPSDEMSPQGEGPLLPSSLARLTTTNPVNNGSSSSPLVEATGASKHAPTVKAEKVKVADQDQTKRTPTSADDATFATNPTTSGTAPVLPRRIRVGAEGKHSPERKLTGYGIMPHCDSDSEAEDGVQKSPTPRPNSGIADSLTAGLERCSISAVFEDRGARRRGFGEFDVSKLAQRMLSLEHKVDALSTENETLKHTVIRLCSETEAARRREENHLREMTGEEWLTITSSHAPIPEHLANKPINSMEVLLNLSHAELEAWVSYYLDAKIEGDRPTLVYTLCRKLGVPLPNEVSDIDWLTCTSLNRVGDNGLATGVPTTAPIAPPPNTPLSLAHPAPFPSDVSR